VIRKRDNTTHAGLTIELRAEIWSYCSMVSATPKCRYRRHRIEKSRCPDTFVW